MNMQPVPLLSRGQKKLPTPPQIRWPNFEVYPKSHEEHTAIIFELCDQIQALTKTATGGSDSETKVLSCLQDLAEFTHTYARYTAYIMGSGKTLATKEDLEGLLIKLKGDDLSSQNGKRPFSNEKGPEEQWEDDKYFEGY